MLAPRSTTILSLTVPLLLLFATMSGCVLSQTTDGASLDESAVTGIEPGRSTRADVTAQLGPPDEIVYSNHEHDPLFEKIYIYKRPKTKQTGLFLVIFATHRSDTKYDKIAVFFDDKGVVEHIGSRLQAKDASYGMPW